MARLLLTRTPLRCDHLWTRPTQRSDQHLLLESLPQLQMKPANQSRQPAPGAHLGCVSTSLTRRRTADR